VRPSKELAPEPSGRQPDTKRKPEHQPHDRNAEARTEQGTPQIGARHEQEYESQERAERQIGVAMLEGKCDARKRCDDNQYVSVADIDRLARVRRPRHEVKDHERYESEGDTECEGEEPRARQPNATKVEKSCLGDEKDGNREQGNRHHDLTGTCRYRTPPGPLFRSV
jgi:hypothetical protein